MNKELMAFLFFLVGTVFIILGFAALNAANGEQSNNVQPQSETIPQTVYSQPNYSQLKQSQDTVKTVVKPEKEVIVKTVYVEKEVVKEVEVKSPDDNRTKEEIIGQTFEDYFVNLLADSRFRLLDRTTDKTTSEGVYAESCMNPDLHISQERNPKQIDYYVECKYRSSWRNGEVKFEQYQVTRYKEFQRSSHRKVLFALGVGGKPAAPSSLMIVPLDSLEGTSIKQDWQQKYGISATSSALYRHMDEYFTDVFAKSKRRRY